MRPPPPQPPPVVSLPLPVPPVAVMVLVPDPVHEPSVSQTEPPEPPPPSLAVPFCPSAVMSPFMVKVPVTVRMTAPPPLPSRFGVVVALYVGPPAPRVTELTRPYPPAPPWPAPPPAVLSTPWP